MAGNANSAKNLPRGRSKGVLDKRTRLIQAALGPTANGMALPPTQVLANAMTYYLGKADEVLKEIAEARAQARGVTGRFEVWRRGKISADMQLDIERGALSAIRETPTQSLRLVPWHPWWRTDDVDPNAVFYGGVQPPAAVCDWPVGGHLPTKTAARESIGR